MAFVAFGSLSAIIFLRFPIRFHSFESGEYRYRYQSVHRYQSTFPKSGPQPVEIDPTILTHRGTAVSRNGGGRGTGEGGPALKGRGGLSIWEPQTRYNFTCSAGVAARLRPRDGSLAVVAASRLSPRGSEGKGGGEG